MQHTPIKLLSSAVAPHGTQLALPADTPSAELLDDLKVRAILGDATHGDTGERVVTFEAKGQPRAIFVSYVGAKGRWICGRVLALPPNGDAQAFVEDLRWLLLLLRPES